MVSAIKEKILYITISLCYTNPVWKIVARLLDTPTYDLAAIIKITGGNKHDFKGKETGYYR